MHTTVRRLGSLTSKINIPGLTGKHLLWRSLQGNSMQEKQKTQLPPPCSTAHNNSLGVGRGKTSSFGNNLASLRLTVEHQELEPGSQSCSASISSSLVEKEINPPNPCVCISAVGEHPCLQQCCWEGSLPASCLLQNGINGGFLPAGKAASCFNKAICSEEAY